MDVYSLAESQNNLYHKKLFLVSFCKTSDTNLIRYPFENWNFRCRN